MMRQNSVNVAKITSAVLAACIIITTLIISSITLDTAYSINNAVKTEPQSQNGVLPATFGVYTAGTVRD